MSNIKTWTVYLIEICEVNIVKSRNVEVYILYRVENIVGKEETAPFLQFIFLHDNIFISNFTLFSPNFPKGVSGKGQDKIRASLNSKSLLISVCIESKDVIYGF